MKPWAFPAAVFAFAALAAVLFAPGTLAAQSRPTASRTFEPSAFLGLTGTYTGLEGGRNLAVTAGLDLGFHPFFGFDPSIEVRGTYPVDSGSIAGERDILAGLRVQKRFRKLRPYGDILIGRGQLNYQNGGFVVPAQNFVYLQTTSDVISPGVGLEADVTEHWALLLDAQFQHWNVPFSAGSDGPGHLYSKSGTIGVVYRFGWLIHGHPAP